MPIELGNVACGRHWRELPREIRVHIIIAWIRQQHEEAGAQTDMIAAKTQAILFWREAMQARLAQYDEKPTDAAPST